MTFVATVAFAGLTFWFAPRLPMADLPQVAGEVAAWRDLLLGTSKWQSLLYINYFTPYLVGYGLALGLSFVMPISMALALMLTLAYYAFVACCVMLRSRLGGDRRLDWLFIPGFFGYSYQWGFYTFLIAAPIGLVFVLLAHRYADRPTVMMGVILFFADLVLFFSHGLTFLFANAIGGAFLLLNSRRAAWILPALLPYILLGLLCVSYSVIRLRAEVSPSGPLVDLWDWNIISRSKFVMYPVGQFKTDWFFGVISLLMLSAPFVLRARLTPYDAKAAIPMLVTLLVWATMPHSAMHVAHIYQRFALFLLPSYAFMFRATEEIPETSRRISLRDLLLPALCCIFLALHSERLLAFARESADFDEVLVVAQPEYRALTLILDPSSAATGNLVAYLHFPVWYQAEKGGFVEFSFAGQVAQVVRYRRDDAMAMNTPAEERTAKHFNWERDDGPLYRYVFIRHTGPLPPAYLPSGPCQLGLLKSSGSWSLYENVHCHSP